MAGTTATVTIKGIFDASDIQNKVKNIQNILSNLKMPDKLRTDFIKGFEGLDRAFTDFQNKANKGINNKSDAKAVNASYDNIVREFERVDQIVQKIKAETNGAVDLSNFIKVDDSVQAKIESISKEIEELQQQINSINGKGLEEITQAFNKLKTDKSREKITDALDVFKNAKGLEDIEKAIQMIEQAKQSYANLAKSNTPGGQTSKEIVAGYDEIIEKMREVQQASSGLQDQMDVKVGERFNVTAQAVENLRNNLINGVDTFGKYKKQTIEIGDGLKGASSAMGDFGSELEQVKSRISYFLGLSNAINLFKRAVKGSVNTVKDLDKAMTETAVVTDYTVGDMWKQLPEYTKRANKLGVTTKAAYESATLYYQQGLNSEQAAALSTETLKMARIAGLDAAEATDRMTNALRGFNMELDTASAQRIDDVYSQLAAMSASNVDEISTAMTKVASLAHNANMEFETTSAFLAQIIETTRESAETAGTALKTVVARFSEVKNLYEKDELKGQDEEGQAIDVNKVSTALRTAGIDLNKYFLGEVGLDDIFMELASKWDSLTNVQQRYIATQAAGSRQQSRFIALMQDYSRTQELVGAAYDSSGASEKQFEKTQDSLESKLARLTNAWNEFLMGITNNSAIKFVVDALTGVLNFVNKITGALGDVGGSFAKIGLVVGGIGGLKAGLNSEWFGNLLSGFKNSPIASFLSGKGFKGAKDIAEETTAGTTLTTAAATAGGTIEASAATAGGTIEASAAAAQATTQQGAANVATSMQEGGVQASTSMQEGGTQLVQSATSAGEQLVSSAQGAGAETTNAASTAGNLLVQGAAQAKNILSGQDIPTGGGSDFQAVQPKLLSAGNTSDTEPVVEQITQKKNRKNGRSKKERQARREAEIAARKASKKNPSIDTVPEIDILGEGTPEIPSKQGTSKRTVVDVSPEQYEFIPNTSNISQQAEIADELADSAKITKENTEALQNLTEIGDDVNDGVQNLKNSNKVLADQTKKNTKNLGKNNALQNPKTPSAPGGTNPNAPKAGTGGVGLLGPALLAAIAVAVTAITAYSIWKNVTPEGQVKQSEEIAEATNKIRESADQINKTAQDAQTEYAEKTEAIDKARSVTTQQKAIEDRNQFLENLIQKDSNFAKYVKSDFKNGQYVLSIEESDMKKYAETTAKAAKDAQFSSLLSQAMVSGNQARAYESKINGVDFEKQIKINQNQNGVSTVKRLSDEDLSEYRTYESRAVDKKAESKAQAKQAFMQIVDVERLGDETANLVAGVLAESFDSAEYLEAEKKYYNAQRNEKVEGGFNAKAYWQNQYYERFGTAPQDFLTIDQLRHAIASDKAQNDLSKKYNEILTNLVDSNQELYKPLLKAINGDLSNEITLDVDIGDYINNLLAGRDIDTLRKAMGDISLDELKTILENNIKKEKEVQAKNLTDLRVRTLKAGAKPQTFNDVFNLHPEEVQQVLGFADQAEKSLGKSVAEFYDNLTKYAKQGQIEDISTFFGSFDLEQPIKAVQTLNKYVEDDSNPLFQELATKVKDANKQLSDVGYLTQIFMTSEAYESISDNVDELIEKNKEITANEVEELAKSCKDLDILLKQDGVSAQGLARGLTAVGSGKANIEGLTTAVIKTLGATEGANTAIDKLFKSIDEFDEGRDLTKAVDFANDKIESLKSNLENLEFGNENFRKNYEYFFNDYEKFAKLDTAGRKSLLESNIERIDNLLKDDAFGALKELSQIRGSGLTVTHEDEEQIDFNWDVGDKTWNELRDQVSSELGVNEQIAETIMTAAAAYMPELRESLDLNGFKKDIEVFNQEVKGQAVVTEQELAVLAQSYGKTTDEIFAQMQASAKGKISDLPVRVNWQNEKGKNLTGEELINQFRQQVGNLKNIVDKNEIDINGKIDSDKILSILQEQYKLSSGQAKEIINDYLGETGKSLTKTVKMPVEIVDENGNGTGKWEIQDVQVEAKTVEGLEAEVKLKENEAQWTQLSQIMSKALSQAIITPGADPGPAVQAIKTAVEGETYQITVHGTYTGTDGAGDTAENTGTIGAAGGIVRSYANGSRHISPGIALTGEEGPELVWNKRKGYAYFAGKNGPEFTDLKPGDQIFPADETKRIVNRGETPAMAGGGKVYPSFAEVKGSRKIPKDENDSKGSGGSGDKKKDDEFKMDLDKYYNMVEDINELLRLRELLEKNYNQLLKQESKTGKEIYDNLNKQLDLLEERRKITEDLAQKRKQQILDLVEENKELADYAWWNDEDLTIEIDWDLVNTIDDKEKGGEVKDYLSKLEDFQSKYDEQIEALEEIEDAVQDIRERGKDQYNSLEERTRDALIKQIQDRIDELSEVEEAINDTNQRLFDSMQQTLEQQRQERDNAKTEEELTDKEKRLAYLQQDSSNANALEIAKLQEELADARQSYTDTLIDQKISELQKQNEEASEQRQQQIDLMQRSLDWQEKSGAFWETVYQYISEGTDAVGALVHESELEKLLKTAETWDQLSEEQKKSWAQELIDQIAQGIAYLELNRQLEDIGTKEGTKISFTVPSGETLTGTVDKNGNVVVKNSDGSTTTYKDIFQDYHGQYRTFEESGEVKKAATNTKKSTKPSTMTEDTDKGNGSNGDGKDGETYLSDWKHNDSQHWKVLTTYNKGKKEEKEVYKANHVYKTQGNSNVCTVCGYSKEKIAADEKNNLYSVSDEGYIQDQPKWKYKYASGGLNTQTGPAWLDGTLSKPELVLNARDTQNFIELKDVLADMRKNGGLYNLSGGDNYYNINVNVDQMSSDYDVDRAIDRIKTRLAQDGAYRNVNTLSRLR